MLSMVFITWALKAKGNDTFCCLGAQVQKSKYLTNPLSRHEYIFITKLLFRYTWSLYTPYLVMFDIPWYWQNYCMSHLVYILMVTSCWLWPDKYICLYDVWVLSMTSDIMMCCITKMSPVHTSFLISRKPSWKCFTTTFF